MISTTLRDGMTHIAAFEAVRFSVWAKLVAYRHTEAATTLLQLLGRVQAAMSLALHGRTAVEQADGRAFVVAAFDDARRFVEGTLHPILDTLQGTVSQNVRGAIGALERLALSTTVPPGIPDVHPAEPPPSNGTHRARKKPHAT